MSLSDKFLVAFILSWLSTTGIFWYKGMYGMALLWAEIFALVLAMEALCYVYVGHTVTQIFRELIRQDPGTGWGLVFLMSTSWALLMLHFGIGIKR